MLKCSKCNISIRGDKKCCPLCMGPVSGEPEDSAFFAIRPQNISRVSAFRIASFICVITEIIMGLLFYASHYTNAAFLLVMLVAPLCLSDFAAAIFFKENILKLITTQVYLIMLICYIVDIHTGFIGWSVIWVIPALFVILTAAVIIIGQVTRSHIANYIIYPVLNVILSLLQGILIKAGRNPFPMPAMISMGIMLSIGAFIFIFRFRELKSASNRYLNI